MARTRSASRGATALSLACTALALFPARGAAQNFTPSQIRTAYNVSGSAYTGAGQTIAIVDSDNDTTALSDANKFSSSFSLTTFNSGGPTLTVVGQTGLTTSLPKTVATGDGLDETSLDIQWAHAIAPSANIVLVEANSLNDSDLVPAINTAKNYAGVSAVSMSFGADEYSSETGSSTSVINDATFAAPNGHIGVTFLASTGDTGTQSYPAASSKVLAVGGTRLTLNSSYQRTAEVVWNDTEGSTGSGVSAYETKPTYQSGIGTSISSIHRIIPDVVWNGDPESGQEVVVGGTLYGGFGGTSISCPQWAGVMALANQARVLNGMSTLSDTNAMTALYSIYVKYYGTSTYSNYFNDITSGTANNYSATAGYDAASGLGSPNVANIVSYLGVYPIPEPASMLMLVAAGPLLLTRRRANVR